MPFIVSRVNKKIDDSDKEKLRAGYIEKIERILGKPRSYIMLDIQDNCTLFPKGENQPAAYIEANIYGNRNNTGYAQLSQEVTDMFNEILNIPSENIFINFQDIPGFSIDGNFF